jgi:mannitol/fructose-specific phosphotransferase system IIA component (Ntr-type)
MQISDLLKPEQIKLSLVSDSRLTAIQEVALLLEKNPQVLRFKGFSDDLLAREKVESTCLGHQVAFPHARTNHLKGMVLAIGRSLQVINFETGNQLVHLIFVIGTPKRMATDYLSVVGGLARVMKGDALRHQLLHAATPEEVIEIMSAAEKVG